MSGWTDQAEARTPLSQLSGSYSGSGSVRLASGKRERIRCRAYYRPLSGGSRLNLAIRCASPAFKIELRSQLRYANGLVSGSWSERTFNAGGSVSGRARKGRLNVNIRGGISGRMNLAFSGRSQRISISTSSTNLRGVSISLSR
ncbi:MAG: hypothetical protein AAFR23_00710 [Pseudomonadota bacterium]